MRSQYLEIFAINIKIETIIFYYLDFFIFNL